MLIYIQCSGWRKMLCTLLVLGLASLVCFPEPMLADEDDKPFQPGRAIQVTIWQEPDLSGEYSIDSEGYIILPLIGRVNVSRFTKDSLESYLTAEYSNYLRSPIIMIEPLIRVGVLGEVKQPGLFKVSPHAPLWDVVDMAGGPTVRANIKSFKIMRNGEIVSSELLGAFEEGESLQNIGIESGDLVLVPTSRRAMEWRTVVALMSMAISTTFFIVNQVNK
jgi:polysaccharide export outer membrane protein